MKATKIPTLVASVIVFGLMATQLYAKADSKIEQKQNDIRDMAHKTLQRLYEAQPKARLAVKGVAGYAVFSNLGKNSGRRLGHGQRHRRQQQNET